MLAGRSASSAADGIKISGRVEVAGFKIDPVAFRKNIAYVMQDDALMATATPREALAFSALLRLPSDTSQTEISNIVSNLLKDLGIEDCADTIIGNVMIKGISGGQRKRTSVGVEMISDPSLLFLVLPRTHRLCSSSHGFFLSFFLSFFFLRLRTSRQAVWTPTRPSTW